MTKKEWSQKLNNRQYREEITAEEEIQAKKDGVLICFGASDDLLELRGILHDEVGVYTDGQEEVALDSKGVILTEERVSESHSVVFCIWNEGGYSWYFKSNIPFEPFDILEEGERYCRGIVLSLEDIKEREFYVSKGIVEEFIGLTPEWNFSKVEATKILKAAKQTFSK